MKKLEKKHLLTKKSDKLITLTYLQFLSGYHHLVYNIMKGIFRVNSIVVDLLIYTQITLF